MITLDTYFYNTKEWNVKALYFFLAFAGVNAFINAYFLITTPKPKGQYHSLDRVNYIAQVEAYVFILFGLALVAFPKIGMVIN
jgi:hypothetical protein